MKDETHVSRRNFIQRLSLLGSAGAFLAACGGDEAQSTTDPAAAPGDAATSTAAADPCDDLSALSEADRQQAVQMRQTLGYVSETPDEDKRCDNCQFWQVPEGTAPCGGCQLIKGPIHPAGYCNSWAARVS